jgi:hypothetical protein
MLHAADKIGSNRNGTQRAACIPPHCHVPRRMARRTLQALDAALCWRTDAQCPTVHGRPHCRAAQVILGDRPVGITVKRLWAALSLWDKVRLLWSLLCEVTSPSLVASEGASLAGTARRC